jgi:transposase-like protein
MPWKDGTKMDERLRFVARRLEGESMSDLCREFGISRKTGHKIFNRYKEEGVISLCDRSRRPVRYANQLPGQIEQAIVQAKKDKPSWGSGAVLEAPAVVAGLDDVAVMGQPIEQRGGHLGVAEDARPFAEGEVGGDDDRGRS